MGVDSNEESGRRTPLTGGLVGWSNPPVVVALPSEVDVRKQAPALLDRAETMLDTYERRGTTNVPGTISLVRDLAEALQAEIKGWASARGDAVDHSLRADKLEAIVRALAATPIQDGGHPDYALYERCVLCDAWTDDGSDIEHSEACAWSRAKRWAEANPT